MKRIRFEKGLGLPNTADKEWLWDNREEEQQKGHRKVGRHLIAISAKRSNCTSSTG